MRRVVFLLSCASFAFAQNSQSPQALLKEAVEAQQTGNLDKAVADYRVLIASYPNIAEIHSNLGAALAAQGNYDQAIDEYKKSLALKPNPQVRLNLALAYYKAGDIPGAVVILKQAHAEINSNLQIVTLLADCYLRLGRNQDVIDLLTPVQQAHPEERSFQYLLGTALVRHGEAAKGQLIIDKILKHGDSAEAHLLMGTTKYMNAEFAPARDDFKRAVDLNPQLPDVYAYYGLSLLATGDQAGARKAFEKELESNPNNFESNLRLGVILRNDDQNDQAMKRLQHALQVRPGDIGARYQIASLELSQGQLVPARQHLESIVKEAPDFLEAHVSLASVYFREKRKADGDRERQIVARLTAARQKQNEVGARQQTKPGPEGNDNAASRFQEGKRLFEVGNYPAAVKQLESAIQLDPEFPGLQSLYGQSLLYTGDPDSALQAFEKELRKTPNDLASNLGAAQILNARKKYEGGLEFGRKALAAVTDSSQAKLAVADSLAGLGRVQQAIPYAEQAVHDLPKSAHAHRVLAAVYNGLGRTVEAGREDQEAEALTAASDPGPNVGDSAPDFALLEPATGKEVRLSDFRGKTPVTLIFGSYTCPNFRDSADALRNLEQQFGSRVPFFLVYIREAHATDQWQSTRNGGAEYTLPTAATMSEKQDHAALCSRKLHLPFAALVDNLNDSVATAYKAWPSRAYIVGKDGRVAYNTRLTELDFQPAKMAAVLRQVSGLESISMK